LILLHYYAKIVQGRLSFYNEKNIKWLTETLKKEVLNSYKKTQ